MVGVDYFKIDSDSVSVSKIVFYYDFMKKDFMV